MKSKLFVCGAIALVCFCCKPAATDTTMTDETPEPTMTAQDTLERGKYLASIMGCHDCHSPKIFTADGMMHMDTTRYLSGHPANEPLPKITDKAMIAPGQWVLFGPNFTASVGPWGTSFSANLTPDVTGIGEWSYDQFKTALTKGKFKGMENGRPLMPPMPWENFRHMTDLDMRAIWAYLHTLKPVSNVVPAYIPPGQG